MNCLGLAFEENSEMKSFVYEAPIFCASLFFFRSLWALFSVTLGPHLISPLHFAMTEFPSMVNLLHLPPQLKPAPLAILWPP